MTAAVVGPLAAGDPARYAALAAALAVVVGGLCLLARVARLGVLAELLSKPVLIGYLAGIAVLMIVSQLGKVTGVPMSGDSTFAEVASFVRGLDELQPATALLAAAVLVLLLVSPRSLPARAGAADRDAGRRRGGRRPRPSTSTASAHRRRSRAGCPPSACPPSAWPTCRPARARPRRDDRGLHRQRAHRPRVRHPQRLPDRRQPGAAGPRGHQPRRRLHCRASR